MGESRGQQGGLEVWWVIVDDYKVGIGLVGDRRGQHCG